MAQVKSLYGYRGTGSSGGSSGGTVSYSTGVSTPKHSDFKRELDNLLAQKQMANNGLDNPQFYDEILERLEPYLSESDFQKDYLTYLEAQQKALSEQENARFEMMSSGQAFKESKKEAALKYYTNPNAYMAKMYDAYDNTLSDLETKINDFAYNGIDTTNLENAYNETISDMQTTFKPMYEAYVNSGSTDGMIGYGWKVTTNKQNGSLEDIQLVSEDEMGGDFAYVQNADYGGLPVYMKKYNVRGQEFIPVAGQQVLQDGDKNWNLSNPDNFSVASLPYYQYPEYEPGSVVKDTKGGLYYMGKDGWYKAEDAGSMTEFYNQMHPSVMGVDFTNDKSASFQNLPTLMNEQVWSMGAFEDETGNSRIINKDTVSGATPFATQKAEPSNLSKFLSRIEESAGTPGLFKKMGTDFNKGVQNYQGSLLDKVRQGVGIAKTVSGISAFEQAAAAHPEFTRAMGSGVYQYAAEKAPGLIKEAGKAVASGIGSAIKAGIQPRKDYAMKESTGERRAANTTRNIISGNF